MRSLVKLSLSFLLCLPMLVLADDSSLNQILSHIRHDGAAEFRYQETRTLELASAPWHGSGLMLSGADGSLIKLQQQPNRVVMAIAGDKMYYWDPAQQQRHVAPLENDGPAGQILLFRKLLQGQIEQLRSDYDLIAEQHQQQWILRLTPKTAADEGFSIEISGDQNPDHRRLLIRQADDESSDYQLQLSHDNLDPSATIKQLLTEAAGE